MPESEKQESGVAFLGLCERAAYVRDGNTNLFKWNVLGLKSIVLAHVFPLVLDGMAIGLAFLRPGAVAQYRLQITDESGKEVGFINWAWEAVPANDDEAVSTRDSPKLLVPEAGWLTAFVPLRGFGFVIERPGVYHVRLQAEGSTRTIGQVSFVVVDAPPLTPDRIAAIRSDPSAMKAVRLELGCKHCPAKYRVYAALERSEKSEAEGWTWYQDVPDKFSCECGKTDLDLTIVRRNLHGLLGIRRRAGEEISFVPLYERRSLETTRSEYVRLVKSTEREEVLQTFIEQNPILLHQFPAERLFPKPPILTFFAADFAIVTPQRELLLIELEKPTTRLLTKKGGVAAELSHAFDQVNDWLHVVDEHRLAVLDSLKIDREQVSTIRGVVIAGRDSGHDAEHLRKLKGRDYGRVRFLTYDDLGAALDALIRGMDAL